jgi:hypothetical protein
VEGGLLQGAFVNRNMAQAVNRKIKIWLYMNLNLSVSGTFYNTNKSNNGSNLSKARNLKQ